ncbi:hypothetical protein E2C01_023058 [Portunus trituberculatus]|uniref:Uncharacterized protein n=1 Tax=Portunus trituberculatus TaxID=210409 RepID=A0A5B7E7U3_PORTR|nr:hypothetical protein [Portunus trituberculatus]
MQPRHDTVEQKKNGNKFDDDYEKSSRSERVKFDGKFTEWGKVEEEEEEKEEEEEEEEEEEGGNGERLTSVMDSRLIFVTSNGQATQSLWFRRGSRAILGLDELCNAAKEATPQQTLTRREKYSFPDCERH